MIRGMMPLKIELYERESNLKLGSHMMMCILFEGGDPPLAYLRQSIRVYYFEPFTHKISLLVHSLFCAAGRRWLRGQATTAGAAASAAAAEVQILKC